MNSLLNQETLKLTELLMPWITILISLIVALWLKDFAIKFMQGLKFRINPAFREGDHVYLDGEYANIVKIGLSTTVFGIMNGRGYVWRYVPNERIPFLRLEKIINSELHMDSVSEKAKKLQNIIDSGQNEKISDNFKVKYFNEGYDVISVNNILVNQLELFIKVGSVYVYSESIVKKNKTSTDKKFIFMLLIALLGGVILNFMPCVLPVLSIKLILCCFASSEELDKKS